jgi:hypothetical protein
MAMDQHPVPQNVTNFQFRIVGDFTLKQVGYLAFGIITGYVLYKSSLPIIFTWPLGILSVLAGIGFAFVPIENRPMDVWVSSFFKRIYSPTLYSWIPPETDLKILEHTNKLALFPLFSYPKLLFIHGNKNSSLPSKPMLPPKLVLSVNSLPMMFSKNQTNNPSGVSQTKSQISTSLNSTVSPKNITQAQNPQPFEQKPTQPQTLPKQSASDQIHLSSTINIGSKQQISPSNNTIPTTAQTTTVTQIKNIHNLVQNQQQPQIDGKQVISKEQLEEAKKLKDMIMTLQNQLSQSASEKNRLEAEKMALQRKLEQTKIAPQTIRQAGTTASTSAPTVQVVPIDINKKQQLPSLTSVANVVTGVIKDDQGMLLPEIIVTIRDKDDVPLRALKTNKLGQFAASTPLQNNTYFIEIEDTRKRYTFDRIQIALNGSLVPLIEIRAKSQKQLERQKLAEQIFGKPVQ